MALLDADDPEEGTGPWPAFADLLAATTLLFLVLFAAIAVPAIHEAGEANARASTLRRIEEAIEAVEERDSSVTVEAVGDYLLVRIRGEATFPLNRFELDQLKPEGRRILRDFGAYLRDSRLLPEIDQIQVVGHTSSEGSEERNWILSASRAATVSLFLIQDVGIPACQVTALGRSRYYPVDAAAARVGAVNEQDRRIELEIRPVIPSDPDQTARRASCVGRRP